MNNNNTNTTVPESANRRMVLYAMLHGVTCTSILAAAGALVGIAITRTNDIGPSSFSTLLYLSIIVGAAYIFVSWFVVICGHFGCFVEALCNKVSLSPLFHGKLTTAVGVLVAWSLALVISLLAVKLVPPLYVSGDRHVHRVLSLYELAMRDAGYSGGFNRMTAGERIKLLREAQPSLAVIDPSKCPEGFRSAWTEYARSVQDLVDSTRFARPDNWYQLTAERSERLNRAMNSLLSTASEHAPAMARALKRLDG